jgi:hypothetical protein
VKSISPTCLTGALSLVQLACGEAPAPACWVADRAAGEVVALDASLCVLERICVPAPQRLAAGADGLWVASSIHGVASPPGRLSHVERRGGAATPSDFAALVALSPEGGSVLGLERHSESASASGACDTLLWRIGHRGERTLLGAFPSARALAVQPGAILVGCGGGELVLMRADGAVLVLGRCPGEVLAVARGPRAGEWWVLDGATERSLRLLDEELAPLWSARVAPGTTRFAAVEGAERVWIAGEGRALLLGPRGAMEAELELPRGPWQVGLATASGALLFGPGAVLEVEVRHGLPRVRRTQGGFRELVALVAP